MQYTKNPAYFLFTAASSTKIRLLYSCSYLRDELINVSIRPRQRTRGTLKRRKASDIEGITSEHIVCFFPRIEAPLHQIFQVSSPIIFSNWMES